MSAPTGSQGVDDIFNIDDTRLTRMLTSLRTLVLLVAPVKVDAVVIFEEEQSVFVKFYPMDYGLCVLKCH